MTATVRLESADVAAHGPHHERRPMFDRLLGAQATDDFESWIIVGNFIETAVD
jgi:hypothetical protein